jgi:DNA-binding NtrC family response regulator
MPEIKQSWPNTRVVILTGFATQETADAAFEQGEVFLLSKPFDSELLQGVIDMALAGKPRG